MGACGAKDYIKTLPCIRKYFLVEETNRKIQKLDGQLELIKKRLDHLNNRKKKSNDEALRLSHQRRKEEAFAQMKIRKLYTKQITDLTDIQFNMTFAREKLSEMLFCTDTVSALENCSVAMRDLSEKLDINKIEHVMDRIDRFSTDIDEGTALIASASEEYQFIQGISEEDLEAEYQQLLSEQEKTEADLQSLPSPPSDSISNVMEKKELKRLYKELTL